MYKPFNYIVSILCCFSFLLSYSQSNFTRNDSIQVKANNQWLKNAWAGGLNNPQFSDIDLNGDGIMDLFIFDRSGNKILTFLNGGKTGEVDYHHAPEYQKQFPALYSWALLIDYNGDGKKDIFTSAYIGVRVFRNDYTPSEGLKFSLATPLLQTTNGTNTESIWIGEWDIPAITDVDGDGDIDILSFQFAGDSMQFFKNLSMEMYGNADYFIFDLADKGWGKFMEAFVGCSLSLGKKEAVHPGSTSLALDLDCDNDKEVIIGDIACRNVTMLTNGGNKDSALMTAMDASFPSTFPVRIKSFPAAFHLDVNNDGLKDLLFAPNAMDISENTTSAWYYKNTESNCNPVFTFQTKAFLQEEMIEVGEGANPVFFDYNGDSLLDIVVGNYGYYSDTSDYNSGLSLYENIGILDTPAFKLITRNYADIFSLKLYGVYPAFGDVDGDGDMDMLIGDAEGKLHFYENKADGKDTADFVLQQLFYDSIDVGKYAAPQLVDVNRDGKLDLLLGERGGNINYFENTGSEFIPKFELKNDSFGGVNVVKTNYLTGYSTPFLTSLDSHCTYDLLVGSESGYIYRYGNIDNNLYGKFTLVDSLFAGINEGIRANFSCGDVNKDGSIDAVVGNYGGGIALYMNNKKTTVCTLPPSVTFSVSIYPNPAAEQFQIDIYGIWKQKKTTVCIYNTLGQLVYYNELTGNNSPEHISIDTRTFRYGLYICKINTEQEQYIKKIVVAK